MWRELSQRGGERNFSACYDFSACLSGLLGIAGGATMSRDATQPILTRDNLLFLAGMKNHVIGKRFTEATRRAVSTIYSSITFFFSFFRADDERAAFGILFFFRCEKVSCLFWLGPTRLCSARARTPRHTLRAVCARRARGELTFCGVSNRLS